MHLRLVHDFVLDTQSKIFHSRPASAGIFKTVLVPTRLALAGHQIWISPAKLVVSMPFL